MRSPAVDEERDPRAALLRALLSLACGGLAAAVCVLQGASRLDVALWAVLVPILVAALLALAPRARRRASETRRPHAQVVVPDGLTAAPDPAVQARTEVVARARAALLAAREREAPMEELLAMARALHEAELDLARATASCGGHVAQALRDELLLRERPSSVST